MSDTLITNLTSGNPAQSGDEIPINRGGEDRKITAGSIAALASGGGLPLQLPIQDGRYYFGPGDRLEASQDFDIANLDGLLLAMPIKFVEAKTWTKIGVSVAASGALDVVRVGLYADSSGLPGDRIVDAGELSLAATGEVEATISQALSANTWYWRVIAGNPVTGTAALTGFSQGSNMAGYAMGLSEGALMPSSGYWTSFTYGALPASFGTPEYDDVLAPRIWLRTGV